MVAGRYEEGVDLHRNALIASPLGEVESMNNDLGELDALVGALFATQRFDEMEETRLLPRLEAAAKKESRRVRVVCYQEFRSVYYDAKLHEVLSSTHVGDTFALLGPGIPPRPIPDSICHTFHHARAQTAALLQQSPLNPQPAPRTPHPSTLNPQPQTLNPQPSPLTPQPSPLTPHPSTLNCRSPKVRGRPLKAAIATRALLDLARKNPEAVQHSKSSMESMLLEAGLYLKSLDPRIGEEERRLLVARLAYERSHVPW